MRAVILASIVFAGCLAPAGTVPSGRAPTQNASALLPVDAVACSFTYCYEPNLATDPQGRIFATDGRTSDVGVSTDGGSSFARVKPPPAPGGGTQSDVIVQVSPAGRLYYSALVIPRLPGNVPVSSGIQVAWSDDGAATWMGDVLVGPTGDPTDAVISPDRQWLGFGPGATVYLTYNQIPTGIWFARSDDAGKTWSGWVRAAPPEQRGGGIGQSGPPVVDADGVVLVPACSTSDASVRVFRSEDKGSTWSNVAVPGACGWFPIVTIAPQGKVVLAWFSDNGAILVATSLDHAKTFGKSVEWGAASSTSPWPIIEKNGALAIAWFKSNGTRSDLHLASGAPDSPPAKDITIASGIGEQGARSSAMTDFASAAQLPDGRIATIFVKGKEALVTLVLP